MDHFSFRDGRLYCEAVALEELAGQVGTPAYVYSRATIERHVNVLKQALDGVPNHICYAVKANPSLAVLDLMRSHGVGFDAVSGGELARVMTIGADLSGVILSGVGKRDDEIERAINADLMYICAESREEVLAIDQIARRLNQKARVTIRVNPNVDAQTHPYIATGLKENKFGVPSNAALRLAAEMAEMGGVELCGLSCHIGSQITQLAPFRDAATLIAGMVRQLRGGGVPIRYLGVGGGLGIPYGAETPPGPDAYGRAVAEAVGDLDVTLVLEPGRVLVGNAGVLLSRVVRKKPSPSGEFVIVDAGMNDLMRPALYGAEHQIVPVVSGTVAPASANEPVTIVGPVCESADTFARDLNDICLATGDLIAIRSAGAYGFCMSSTYNGRPRPAEVLCDGDRWQIIRDRETEKELWRGERRLAAQNGDENG